MVIFHGNSAVERSFSLNKSFLVEILKEHSLKAQGSLHDFISSVGKVGDIEVTNNMMTTFSNSSRKD